MASRRPPYLLLIRSGPSYEIVDRLGFIARAFSSISEGEICTYGPFPEHGVFNGFSVRLVRVPFHSGLWRRIPFMLWVLWRGFRARWVKGRHVVTISYDPFQSGALGVLVKWLTAGTLICEVNGDFAHPVTLASNRPRGERVRRGFLAVGSWVLRRADAIKYLFPGQLDAFAIPQTAPPRTRFANIVDTEVFRPSSSEGENLLLFVGHPFNLKGVDLLAEAFQRLSPEFPSWRLLLIGHRVEQQAKEAGVRDHPHIQYLSPQAPSQLADWMSRCKALVLPSRTEAMGRVLLEAAHCGRARIGSTAGGIPIVIEDGVDGLLFASESMDDLVATLRRFMADPALQAALGRGAANRAGREFTVERYVHDYVEIIGTALGGSRDLATEVRAGV